MDFYNYYTRLEGYSYLDSDWVLDLLLDKTNFLRI